MVKVSQETYNNQMFGGSLSDYVIYLYESFTVNPLPSQVVVPNESWKPFIKMLYSHNNQEEPEYIENFNIESKEIDSDKNKVILALSGGKDSAASLLRLLDEGKDVVAYYCKKINLSYLDEEGAAENIAKMCNVPLLKDEISRSGKSDFFENPVKNMFLLARMIEWSLDNNCSVIQLGEYWDLGSDRVNIQYDMSDSIDFILEFEKAINSHFPQIKFNFMFEHQAAAMSYLITKHLDVLPKTISCIMPRRFLNFRLKSVLQSFPGLQANVGVTSDGVMEKRCMMCWKCCMEWLYLVMFGKLPYNKDYMEQKVLPIFIKKMPEIDKTWADSVDVSKASTQEIIGHVIKLDAVHRYLQSPDSIEDDIRHRVI